MGSRADKKVVNFRLKPKAKQEFDEAVKFKGTNVSDVLRKLVRRWVKRVKVEMDASPKAKKARA